MTTLHDGATSVNHDCTKGARVFAGVQLNGVDPYAWLASTLHAVVADDKQSRINDLVPWNVSLR